VRAGRVLAQSAEVAAAQDIGLTKAVVKIKLAP
jgi:hypothetical protein